MTRSNEATINVIEIITKITELIESQERYAAVFEKIQAAKQKILRLADPKQVVTETATTPTRAKERLCRVREKVANGQDVDAFVYASCMQELSFIYLSTEAGNNSFLMHLHAILEGFKTICETSDKHLRQTLHDFLHKDFAGLSVAVHSIQSRESGREWFLATKLDDLVVEIGLNGDTKKEQRETFIKAWAHAKAAVCAIEELCPIFMELRMIDKSNAARPAAVAVG